MVTLAKGSFDVALDCPTMESHESCTDVDIENSPSHSEARKEDDAHHEVTRSGLAPRGPLSNRSMRSVQPKEQVLDADSALDMSESNAVFSRFNKQKHRQQEERQQHQSRNSSPANVNTTRRVLSWLPFIRGIRETWDFDTATKGEFLYYLYTMAILGTSIRVFVGRLFGLDCENPGHINDFLTPLSEDICVTASGQTDQRGGALFIDLPTNMLGCFFMGLFSSLKPGSNVAGVTLPWLRQDHPLQEHEVFHDALTIGLCGSMTTFSSWNSQMITMLDGTDTVLGPQVASALFGYIIGIFCSVGAFIAGGRLHAWLYDWRNETTIQELTQGILSSDENEEQPTSWGSGDTTDVKSRHSSSPISSSSSYRGESEGRNSNVTASQSKEEGRKHHISIFLHLTLPILIVVGLLVVYGVADGLWHIPFYRGLWISSLLTPFGVYIRWKLATLNGRGIGPCRRLEWVPWGTLLANLLAAIVSAIFQAIRVGNLNKLQVSDVSYPWVVAIVIGMETGFAGSMSTVSTMVKEIVNLTVLYPTHAKVFFYGSATIILSMSLGLSIYSPLIRYAQ